MKPLLITSGEPAGIGPDLCLSLIRSPYPVVILGDRRLLEDRAKQLGLDLCFADYQKDKPLAKQHLTVLSIPCAHIPQAGCVSTANASYVEEMLNIGAQRCMSGEFAALVTAPVHKSIMNQAGLLFTGHTEFFAQVCDVDTVVMMLTSPVMRVALVTTHLPLHAVPATITPSLLREVLQIIHVSLQRDFGILKPVIHVAGLNPHAGEGGYLGREEIEVITPVLAQLKKEGICVEGPYPADTLFGESHHAACDVFVAMYHDQGLPVIKYADFSHAVNVTLGLPFIRTSVDHGTALDLAGKGLADATSLWEAVALAASMSGYRLEQNK